MDSSNARPRYKLDEYSPKLGTAPSPQLGDRRNLEALAAQLIDEVQRVKSEMLGVMAAVNALKTLVVELASAVPPEALAKVRAAYAASQRSAHADD